MAFTNELKHVHKFHGSTQQTQMKWSMYFQGYMRQPNSSYWDPEILPAWLHSVMRYPLFTISSQRINSNPTQLYFWFHSEIHQITEVNGLHVSSWLIKCQTQYANSHLNPECSLSFKWVTLAHNSHWFSSVLTTAEGSTDWTKHNAERRERVIERRRTREKKNAYSRHMIIYRTSVVASH